MSLEAALSASDRTEPGHLIQNYIRAKWGRGEKDVSADELGRRMDPILRERIDLLGVDDEKLLGVGPQDVLRRIQELERDALREDSGVSEHRKGGATTTRPSSRNPSPRRNIRPRR
jgi:hypothetical protein